MRHLQRRQNCSFRSPKVISMSSYETQEELFFACIAFVILLAITSADVLLSAQSVL